MKKIMIVDDSQIIRETLVQYLSLHDIEIAGQANDGPAAITLFEKCKADIITMDINMPGMDGMECIERLLAIDPAVKIIVISSNSKKDIAIEALDRGASGYLRKPFSAKDILDAIAEAFG